MKFLCIMQHRKQFSSESLQKITWQILGLELSAAAESGDMPKGILQINKTENSKIFYGEMKSKRNDYQLQDDCCAVLLNVNVI